MTRAYEREMERLEDWKSGNVQECIRLGRLTEEQKGQLFAIKENREPWYWYGLLENEASAMLVIRLAESRGEELLPENPEEARELLFSRLVQWTGIPEEVLLVFLMDTRLLGTMRPRILEERVVLEWLTARLGEDAKKRLKALLETGLLVRWDGWYRLCSDVLPALALLRRFDGCSGAERKRLCEGWFGVDRNRLCGDWSGAERKRLCAGWPDVETGRPREDRFGADRNRLCGDCSTEEAAPRFWKLCGFWERETLEELAGQDREAVSEGALRPLAREYCEEIRGAEGGALLAVLHSCQLTAEINEQGYVEGGSVSGDALWELMELLGEGCIWEMLPEQFGEEQMEALREAGCLEDTGKPGQRWRLHGDKVDSEVLMQAAGLAEGVDRIWKRIQAWK